MQKTCVREIIPTKERKKYSKLLNAAKTRRVFFSPDKTPFNYSLSLLSMEYHFHNAIQLFTKFIELIDVAHSHLKVRNFKVTLGCFVVEKWKELGIINDKFHLSLIELSYTAVI